jgi:hypothetical protein
MLAANATATLPISTNTAAIRSDGTLWLWGYNGSNQLAQPNASLVPLAIGGTPLGTAPSQAVTWQLVPNPAHGQVEVRGLTGAFTLRLFDGQGRLVRTATTPLVELAGLAPGLYLLHATASRATRALHLMVE